MNTLSKTRDLVLAAVIAFVALPTIARQPLS